MLKVLLAAIALVGSLSDALAARIEPVRRIPVFVRPYYAAAPSPEHRPVVEVGRSFDHGLASTTRDEIVAVRDRIVADPRAVMPTVMMVLAIRLYDVGLRDEGVFWFYAARARFITLDDTIDTTAAGLASAGEGMKNFARLAGPYFNSYAFCDPPKQHATLLRALDWVEKNPYETIFLRDLAAKPGDRRANVAQSLKQQRASADNERAKFSDPKFVKQFAAARKKNKSDAMFCWK